MTDAPHVRIVNDGGLGWQTKIYVDGVDVSRCFRGVEIEVGVTGRVVAKLEPVFCEIEVESGTATELVMPDEGTRALLVKYGWTPPAEPATVPVVRKTVGGWLSKPMDLETEMFTHGEPISGRELVNRFFERVQRDWEPNEDDTLTVARVYDEFGELVPGKRAYSLKLTLGSDEAEG